MGQQLRRQRGQGRVRHQRQLLRRPPRRQAAEGDLLCKRRRRLCCRRDLRRRGCLPRGEALRSPRPRLQARRLLGEEQERARQICDGCYTFESFEFYLLKNIYGKCPNFILLIKINIKVFKKKKKKKKKKK